jgi:DNA-binding NarL/FixJ family response regulator
MATCNNFITNAPFLPAAAERAGKPSLRSVRTLLVDDVPAMLEAFWTVLSANPQINLLGTASNGLAAVAFAQAQHPDLILMDINMPGMDGLKAAMHIKARMPETKIILMSADDDPDVARAAVDCGADGFISKRRCAHYVWHVQRWFFT